MKNLSEMLFSRHRYYAMAIILLAVLAVYWQVGGHEFIDFDDDIYVINNTYVNGGFSLDNVLWAFGFGSMVTYWHPLTWLSHMLDCQLFGLDPGWHHLMSLFIHMVNVLLLYLVLRKMTGAVWKSAFVAALFGLHPVNVDSVAWLAERKNLLSTTFWLLTMLVYAYHVEKPRYSRYFLLILVFCLGLLSKPMLMTLPFSLFLLDYWPLRRFSVELAKGGHDSGEKRNIRIIYQGTPVKQLIVEKIPLFILSITSIIISTKSLRQAGLMVPTYYVPMDLRIENAIVSYIVYILKMIWPFNLTFFYPYPESIPLVQVIGSLGALLLVTVLALKYYSRAPYFLIGWLWFLGTLFPVSGIVQAGLWPAIAERWAYVPYIGLFIIIAWGVPDFLRGFKYSKAVLSLAAVQVLMVFSIVTWIQTGHWKNDVSLFTHGMKVDPKNYIALVNMGGYYEFLKEYNKAIPYHLKALEVHQGDVLALGHLARIYDKLGDDDKTISYYSSLIRFLPNDIESLYGLGSIYAERGDMDKASTHFSKILSLDPRHPGANYNLGVIAAKKGEMTKALKYLSSALKHNPQDIESHLSLGVILMNMGKISEAVDHFLFVLKADPGNRDAIQYLADAREYKNKRQEEISLLKQKLSNDPGSLYKLAVLHSSIGEYSKALDIMNKLLEQQPNNASIYYNIACIYSNANKVNESLDALRLSIEKGFSNWQTLENDPDLNNIREADGYKQLIKMKRT